LDTPVVAFERVSKEYLSDGAPVTALREVTLSAGARRFVALMGKSGCGKSTLLNLAGAMDFPTSGDVKLGGESTRSLDDLALTLLRREKVGFVFQSFQLLPNLTAVENIELPLLLARGERARERAKEALHWVELEGYESRPPHQLSGGQMQRVAIARALVHSPKLLLADEPTGNLDTATGEMVLKLLRRAVDERGATILMATHSLESTGVCDEIVRLRDGRIEA
jgi:ABC-type lipoprotein export system ATPase subunit